MLSSDNNKVVVTGASGFVGLALCKQLLIQGYHITAVSRNSTQDLINHGIKIEKLDISSDFENLVKVFKGANCVFHVASKVDMWGPYKDFYQANVIGTENVLAACRAADVKYLVYTSSPSVVADGSNLCGINESYPIPEQHHANYPATKAQAEKIVLSSNSQELKTLALRPHLIFGPGDRHFIPTILARAKQGRLKIIGSGENLVDVCFIEDCVNAHIDAMNSLLNNPNCAGKAYFISQGQPIKLWDFINKVLELNNIKTITFKVPKSMAFFLASVFELISKVLPIATKPLFTKFLVSEMTTDHYFNIQAAKDDLGFKPTYSVYEALLKTFPAAHN